MRQGRLASIIFSAASMIVTMVYIILFVGADRSAPEFTYQETNVSYREGMDRAELLTGVSAYDDGDGDVTERIVIEKVSEDREGGFVVVFYAVSDLSGNAAKSSRVFDAVFDQTEETGNKNVREETGSFPEAGIEAEIKAGVGQLE